jgi:hypothetical protein
MESESDYLPLQQPGAGYDTPGPASGAANYGAQQSPASAYAQQQSQGSGGGGSGTAQATKTYILPDPETGPWSGLKGRVPRVSTLPLYEKGKAPSYDQIRQQNIGNCYLGATLAAMANTRDGRSQIVKMITPQNGAITTICKEYDSDNKSGPEQRLTSNRWFTVTFKQQSVEVSEVLYHTDSDHNPNLMYMTTPNGDRALWGAIVEVAYAKLKGGYDNIGAPRVTVNTFLDEFSAVKWAILDPAKDKNVALIKKACKNARNRAAFIATKSEGVKILPHAWHGYAVLGMSGEKVKLWDPLDVKAVEIEFKDLLTEVQAVIGS